MAKQLKRAFYRPHARVQYTGLILDPVTGELAPPVSRVKQEFKRECDVNNILKQYSRTGMLNHVSARAAQGMYADLPDSVDYQESIALVRDAEYRFMSLPAKIRDRFGNDPASFLAFCADPKNLEEMRALGLANKPTVTEAEPPPPSEPPADGQNGA